MTIGPQFVEELRHALSLRRVSHGVAMLERAEDNWGKLAADQSNATELLVLIAEWVDVGYRTYHLLDALLVGLDLLDGENPARLVPARGVAHAGGAAAHQRDRLAGTAGLQPVEHHHGVEMPDVQRRGGAVVADVCHHLALGGERVQAREIRALVDEAALVENVEEIRRVGGHGMAARGFERKAERG